MADNRTQITELADLMTEFGLSEAHLKVGELSLSFKKKSSPKMVAQVSESVAAEEDADHEPAAVVSAPVQTGIPVSSPMTGIFYASPNPSSPNYVTEGESVSAGQVVGLIEAMKVFNEIPCPLSGVVTKVVAVSGQLVQPGDPLFYVG